MTVPTACPILAGTTGMRSSVRFLFCFLGCHLLVSQRGKMVRPSCCSVQVLLALAVLHPAFQNGDYEFPF